MKRSLLIIGHGSRSPEAQAIFSRVVDMVREKGDFDLVVGAHMSLAEPDINQAIDELAGRDVKEIVVVPYFLYPGMHIKHDIPEIIARVAVRHPGIAISVAGPIGDDPLMADLILHRALSAESFTA